MNAYLPIEEEADHTSEVSVKIEVQFKEPTIWHQIDVKNGTVSELRKHDPAFELNQKVYDELRLWLYHKEIEIKKELIAIYNEVKGEA